MTAADMPSTVKLAAARALLERLREKTALTRWWRHNASAKHGVPLDEPPLADVLVLSHETAAPRDTRFAESSVPRAEATLEVAAPSREAQTPAPSSDAPAPATATVPHSRWRDALLAALAATGLIGGGIATGYWLTPSSPVIHQGGRVPREMDPYTWIQNQGEHLP